MQVRLKHHGMGHVLCHNLCHPEECWLRSTVHTIYPFLLSGEYLRLLSSLVFQNQRRPRHKNSNFAQSMPQGQAYWMKSYEYFRFLGQFQWYIWDHRRCLHRIWSAWIAIHFRRASCTTVTSYGSPLKAFISIMNVLPSRALHTWAWQFGTFFQYALERVMICGGSCGYIRPSFVPKMLVHKRSVGKAVSDQFLTERLYAWPHDTKYALTPSCSLETRRDAIFIVGIALFHLGSVYSPYVDDSYLTAFSTYLSAFITCMIYISYGAHTYICISWRGTPLMWVYTLVYPLHLGS